MNPYQLIMKIQQKLQQDPNFANRFNRSIAELSNVPGLQQQVIKIAQINDDAQRQQVIDRLPKDAKNAVKGLLELLNDYGLL